MRRVVWVVVGCWAVGWAACGALAPPAVDLMGVGSGPREVVEADVAYHRAAAERALAWVSEERGGGHSWVIGDSPLPPFLGVDRGTAKYLGVDACTGCHPDQAAVWHRTAHAHAWRTLRRARSSADPRCLGCHVQGLGHRAGYTGEIHLRDVGCESCHGPGSDHVAAPAPGYGQLPSEAAACIACHDLDTSPDFRWEEQWPGIAH